MKEKEVNNNALGDALMSIKKEFDSLKNDFEAGMDRLKNDFEAGMDRLIASADRLGASMDSLNASLDKANRWAALAQEAAEIKAARTRTGSSGIILKESVTEIPNPCENPPKHWIKIEGPIV